MNEQTLADFLAETDALTYINALKVTLTEIKDEISQQDELRDYMNQSAERTRKLMRKADNQYRIVAKLVSKDAPAIANKVTVEDSIQDFDDLQELMSDV